MSLVSISAALNHTHVQQLFNDCIIMPSHAVAHEGDVRHIQFRRRKVHAHRHEIASMLTQLHPSIYDGTEWLNYMLTPMGEIWGSHQETTQLIALGMAASFIIRLPDSILRYEGDTHPAYHCPQYRTRLQRVRQP